MDKIVESATTYFPLVKMAETIQIKGDVGHIKALGREFNAWRIHNLPINEDFYESGIFSTTHLSWRLRLSQDCIVGVPTEDKYFAIDIWNEVKPKYTMEYDIGLKKIDDYVENLVSGILEVGKTCSTSQCLIRKSELVRRKDELLPSNSLTVVCNLRRTRMNPQSKPLKLTRLDNSLADFKNLFNDEESSDVTLKVQDKEYKAHKSVLIAQSNVFAATFKHDTLERQTAVINTLDCDSNSFQDFLKYLYCCELEELSFHTALNLYYTSNKYGVKELKNFCIDCLKCTLTVETVCETAVFAEKYEETQLLSVVQEFFNEKYSKVLLTPDWKNLLDNNWQLADRLLTEMAKNKQEGQKENLVKKRCESLLCINIL